MRHYFRRNGYGSLLPGSRELGHIKGLRNQPSRMTLSDVVLNKGVMPIAVVALGIEHKVESWIDAYVAVAKQFVALFPEQVSQFVDDMGVSWIGISSQVSISRLSLGNGWFVEIGASDSALVSRLKALVSGVGKRLFDVQFVFHHNEKGGLGYKKDRANEIPVDNSPPPELDDAQKRFVQSSARNARLLAPAGSGKTLAVLHRCKELLSRDKNAKILLVTFTRVARDELKIRLMTRAEFSGLAERINVTTLNQYGNKLLKKRYASCRILSEKTDRKFILGNQLRVVASKSKVISKKIDTKGWGLRNSSKILDLMDAFKTLGMDHRVIKSRAAFEKWHDQMLDGEQKELYLVYIRRLMTLKLVPDGELERVTGKVVYDAFVRFHCAACEALEAVNLFTIEDQKYWGWLALKDSPRVKGAVRYTQIMVDEFQDINPVDMQFIAAIAKMHNADLTLVGDDDQTIFEWRGATPAYILNPDRYFASVNDGGPFETFVLERNYRSPKNIVEMAQRLIRHNKDRVAKNVSAVQTVNADVKIIEDRGFDELAKMIIDDVGNSEIRNIAIISRKKSQLIPYQIIFASQQVDFYAAEDLNIFLTDAFRALTRLISIKMRQSLSYVSRSEIAEDAVHLINHIHRYPLSRNDTAFLKSELLGGYFDSYEELVVELAQLSGIGRFKDFVEAASILLSFFNATTVEDMLLCVSENFDGFKQDFQKADDDIFYADPPFAELAAFSRRYGSDFTKFSEDVELTVSTLASVVRVADDQESVSEQAKESYVSKLHLMTALRTKGKEFDAVYVLETNADTWPIKKANTKRRLEAERRLFYVAVTRAKKRLVFVKGARKPSPYLKEMGLQKQTKLSKGLDVFKGLDVYNGLDDDDLLA